MTRATYRELFPDDEEDSPSGNDRHNIAFPWSRDNYKQNRLTSTASIAEPATDTYSAGATALRPPSRAIKSTPGTPFVRPATRHPSPLGNKREDDPRTPPPGQPTVPGSVSPFPNALLPRGTGTDNLGRDNAPEPESAPTFREGNVDDQHQQAPFEGRRSANAQISLREENDPRSLNPGPQLPLSERDLDEILKALSSEGDHGQLFDLDSSISFSREDQVNLPWSTGITQHVVADRQASVHLPSVQPPFLQKQAPVSLHQRLAHGGVNPSHSPQHAPAVKPRADDPLAMLIQLTHNMQSMSNQVNTLSAANERLEQENVKLHQDVQRLEKDLAAASEGAEYARQIKTDSINHAKRCLQSIKQQYQGLEASLASQKSMYEGSRAKNLALISQLYGCRDDLQKQLAECKTALSQVSESKTSNARQALEALKECQAYARTLEVELQEARRQYQQLESVQQTLQSTFGDTSQRLIAHLESLGGHDEVFKKQSEQLLSELRLASEKVKERDLQVESLRNELQDTQSSILAEAQKRQALAVARDQMALKLEEQGMSSSRLLESKEAEIKRLHAELAQMKGDLNEAHRNEMKHNEGVTVASMELLTLKRGLEAKSKEIESLTARLKDEEESHKDEVQNLKRQLDQAMQQERVATAVAQERKALLDKMNGSTPAERTSNSTRVRRLLPYHKPQTPPLPRNEHASAADQATADKTSNRSHTSDQSNQSKLSTPPELSESAEGAAASSSMREKRKSWEAETLLDGLDPASIFGASSQEDALPPAPKSAKTQESFRVRVTIMFKAEPQPASELVPTGASATQTRPRRKTRKTS